MFFGGKRRYAVELLGSQKLRTKARKVAAADEKIIALASDMIDTMTMFNGIGLAAPQVGVDLQLVVFDVPEDPENPGATPGEAMLLPRMPLAVINPEIISFSGNIVPYREGCLSVPGIFADVMRPERVVFRAYTLAGEKIECECGGLLARCIQHELDHLDGKVFVDHLTEEQRNALAGKFAKLEKYGARHGYVKVKKCD